ncbi:Uncharacterized membrane protein YcaP, DUF421 family [Marinobacter daqiaonensis]|uniref:Uncharacterized membrane protein YcaP, DUF421 family n=1 Tax=Marinobacter daqiaonensis TaxID=650891 RepID=A0A1I6IDR1_9GAMM|nr:YetF domain-containing protein [Marinobacter daqiaonensis]SFR64838.1 Uncharacterized membrane protein YcaP, DUF421 family [Marinobacter daqiaonensis]
MEGMFFNDWSNLVRILIVGVLAYVVLVVFLRISGKRTLSKLNAFDFVVTVALGSTLATVLLNKSISLSEGAMAFALLIGLQLVVTWSSVRVGWIRRTLTGEPGLVLYRGEFMPASMRRARVTEDEVRSAIRSSGVLAMEEVEAVVIETEGSLSVVRRGTDAGRSSLEGVQGRAAPASDQRG